MNLKLKGSSMTEAETLVFMRDLASSASSYLADARSALSGSPSCGTLDMARANLNSVAVYLMELKTMLSDLHDQESAWCDGCGHGAPGTIMALVDNPAGGLDMAERPCPKCRPMTHDEGMA